MSRRHTPGGSRVTEEPRNFGLWVDRQKTRLAKQERIVRRNQEESHGKCVDSCCRE